MAARVRERLETLFERGAPDATHIDDLIDGDDALKAFLTAREEIVTSLTQEVKKAAGDTFLVSMMMGDTRGSGQDGKAVADTSDALELLCYTSQADVVEQMISKATTQYCDADDLICGYSVYSPHTPSAKVLETNVRKALSMGVRGFSFYNYGIMPERNLDWVKSATALIRKADT